MRTKSPDTKRSAKDLTQVNSGSGGSLGAAWIAWVERRKVMVLVAALLLSIVSLGAFYQFGKLNSDLSKLIRPSDSLTWYQHDQQYKEAFPKFEQTAVIVIRGDDYRQVQEYA